MTTKYTNEDFVNRKYSEEDVMSLFAWMQDRLMSVRETFEPYPDTYEIEYIGEDETLKMRGSSLLDCVQKAMEFRE